MEEEWATRLRLEEERQRNAARGEARPVPRCPVALRDLSGFVVAHVCGNDLVLDVLES